MWVQISLHKLIYEKYIYLRFPCQRGDLFRLKYVRLITKNINESLVIINQACFVFSRKGIINCPVKNMSFCVYHQKVQRYVGLCPVCHSETHRRHKNKQCFLNSQDTGWFKQPSLRNRISKISAIQRSMVMMVKVYIALRKIVFSKCSGTIHFEMLKIFARALASHI